jgi:uncharacterized protein (DUF362 family)
MASRRPVHVAYAEHASYGRPPFDPPSEYAEFARGGFSGCDPTNTAYDLVRRSLRTYDSGRFGGADWNPLGVLVRPGDTVVLKPNLVTHDWRPGLVLRTHASVIRALADYVCLALQGRGRLVICDCPIQGADFDRLSRESGLPAVVDALRQRSPVAVELVDLRTEWARVDDTSGFIVERRPLPGDPAGSVRFDLKDTSALAVPGWDPASLAVGDYGGATMTRSHGPGRHEYQFARTVLEADVVLSVAKMKTHQKAGITGALKNTVGMTTAKDGLPHYRAGAPPAGDEYPAGVSNRVLAQLRRGMQGRVPLPLWRFARRLAVAGVMTLRRVSAGESRVGLIGGGWAGNDTVWRMVLDVNRILQVGRPDGSLAQASPRRVHYFVDGIVAGEGDGPLKSTARHAGAVIHGADPVAVDVTMAVLMGFDPLQIPLLRAALGADALPSPERVLDDLEVWCDPSLIDRLELDGPFPFRPPGGWPNLAGSLERSRLAPWLTRFVRCS